MFHRFILIAALVIHASIHSSLAMAITSVCGGSMPASGEGNALRHEATWALHDNWFHNLSVQMHSSIEGPVSVDRVDTMALAFGGQHLHQLTEPQAGHYTVQGQLQVGYPLAWGFDDYYTVACQPWQGEVTAELADTDEDAAPDESEHALSEEALAAMAGIDIEAWLQSMCTNAERSALCEQVQSLTGAERAQFAERIGQSRFPLHRMTGFLAAMDDKEIIVRTTEGHYARFDLAAQVTLSRHTPALYSAVRSDDWVQVQRLPEREARVSVFRGGAEQLPEYRSSPDLSRAVELPADTIVTIIEPAERRELQPIISYVRIVASARDDGQLEVHRIEVLR